MNSNKKVGSLRTGRRLQLRACGCSLLLSTENGRRLQKKRREMFLSFPPNRLLLLPLLQLPMLLLLLLLLQLLLLLPMLLLPAG